MYHCHTHFYLTGRPCRAFEIIREASPLEHFTHEFAETENTEPASVHNADIIFAHIQGPNAAETCRTLIASKAGDAQLILLVEKEDSAFLSDVFSQIHDLWSLPMSDEEIRFRFARWQQNYKINMDFRQSEHYLDVAINNSPNLIWYKDKEGRHEKVNDSFCKTVRKTKAQVEGQCHAYIWDVEQDDPACQESEREVMEKKITCISEEVIKTGEGMKTLTTYKSPLYDMDGSVMGTMGLGIDITKERAYEQEILQKNHTLESIFMTLDCGIMSHTLDGSRILSINDAALNILGYDSLEEMMADGFNMVAKSIIAEDRPRIRSSIMELKNAGDSVSVEYRVLHKDGQILHVMGNIKLIEENGMLFYRRFLLDCTAQKLQEEKSQKLQKELIHSLCINYNVVCFFDLDIGRGKALRLETNDETLLSVFSGDIALKECMELYIQKYVHAEDREILRTASSPEKIREELSGNQQFSVNYRKIENGQTEYFRMKVVRAGVWEEGFGIVLGFSNVDEETRWEMEQKTMLEDALAQAQNASRAKSAFLSNMSHDIRTPMNAIVGFTSLAITHMDHPDQVEEYLQKIMTSGKHLLSLINDVLDMSRIESGKMRLDEAPCSLPEILEELRNIVQADINAKQMKLNVDTVNLTDEYIYCDKLRLNQVLLNLLSNAIKYTAAGGTVSMRITEKAGAPTGYANYEFYVKDTGIGMSEDFVAHIFEPFERERTSTISGIQGTGLGMAITKNIVDMMHGTILVKSKQGAGSEFMVCFTFRLHSGAEGPACTPQYLNGTNEKDNRQGSAEFYTGRILLAEDIELNQELAAAILNEAGFTTEIAGNGREAFEMVQKSEPGYYQLVLMDVQMPVMNGYEATRQIRALDNKELAQIPILAMTANAFEEDKMEALQCGMNGHIAKPIDIDQLFGAIDQILSVQ